MSDELTGPRAILIDGPRRGDVVELDSQFQRSYSVTVPVAVSLDAIDGKREVFYQIHRVQLFGERVTVGSINMPPRNFDLFELLMSNAAKEARVG